MKKRNLKKPIISALEQRILFDGAAVATAVDVLDNSSFSSNESSQTTSNNDATSNSAENSVHEVQAVQGFERDRREVAFVDVTVKDYQTLVDGVGEGTEVYLISSLDEIKTTLSSQTNIDAIHILSHGNTGEITIGKDVLNSNTLDDNAQLLETMKNSLSENGDILLYGCNVASDGTGQEFIDLLASETQADVAASDDLTGSNTLNGDWDLEVISGVIETQNLVLNEYSNTLDNDADGNFNFSPIGTGSAGTSKYLNANLAGSGTGTITIVANDVDYAQGERNAVYFKDANDTSERFLGYLQGSNGVDSTTTFNNVTFNTGGTATIRIYGEVSGWVYNVISANFVTSGNASPEFTSGTSATVAEDGSVNITVSGKDGMTLNDNVTLSLHSGPSHGTISGFATQSGSTTASDTFTYTPSGDYNGSDSITFKLTDGIDTVYQTININVTAVADIANDTISVNEDSSVTYNLLSNDSFEGTESISSVTQGAYGNVTIINASTGDVSYTPRTANWNGSDSFTYTVLSGGKYETATVYVTVLSVNDTPTVTNNASLKLQAINEDVSSANNKGSRIDSLFDPVFNDIDSGDSLSSVEVVTINADPVTEGVYEYSTNNGTTWSTVTVGAILDDADKIRFTPVANYFGTPGTITVKLRDQGNGIGGVLASSGTATLSVQVNSVNDIPVITSASGAATITETSANDLPSSLTPNSGSLSGIDVEDGANINFSIQGGTLSNDTYTLQGKYGVLSLDTTTNNWTYTPNKQEALNALAAGDTDTDEFMFKIIDSNGAQANQSLVITLVGANDVPNITVESGDSDSSIINETNTTLSTNGTLSVIDLDRTDVITTSYVVSSVQKDANGNVMSTDSLEPTNVDLLNMLSITQTPIDGSNQTGTISWAFDSGSETFDYLASGETLTLTYTIKAIDDDSSNAFDEQTITITIVGTNDVPNITVESGDSDSSIINETNTTLSTNGTLSVIDLDRTDVITTSYVVSSVQKDANGNVMSTDSLEPTNVDLLNMLSITQTPIDGSNQTGTISWAFDSGSETFDYLASGETLTLTYTIKAIDDDSSNAFDEQTITITIVGTNDVPNITVESGDSDSSIINETNTTLSTNGTLSVIDLDRTDVITTSYVVSSVQKDANGNVMSTDSLEPTNVDLLNMLSITQTPIDGSNQTGTISWAFDSGSETFDYLASGETLTLTYTIKAIDDDSSNAFDEQTITITIVGTNDVPNITVESGDSDSSIINETNTTLSTNGTLSVIDLDRTDVITTSYVVSSVQKDANGNVMSTDSLEPTNVDLLNMLSITQTPIDGSNQTGTISWAFDSGSETFDYLASGETLTLTYTIKATDDDSSNAFDEQTITITIVGTNDVPNITVESGDSDSSIINETNTTLSTNGTLSVIDLDRTDVITTSYVVSSVQKDANGNVMSTDSLEPTNVDLLNMLSITQTPIDGSNQTGTISWAFDSGSETFDYLASGETLTLTYTIKAIDDDSSNAFDEQTITITIVGTNDVPNITVESGDSDSSIINETNTTLSTNGTLSVIDLDRTDVITTSYVVSSVQKDANGNVMSTDSLEPTNVDLLNMLSITQTPIDGSNQTGTISWAFDSGSETFDYLASGETLTLTYTIKAIDDDSSNAFDEQTITITIVGTNDVPNITVESGDSDSSIINETNTTLSTNGTLSVIDLDRTDVITTSYVVSSVQKDANGNVMSTDSLEPTNVDLLNMLSITQTPIDGSNQTGTISWAFDSGSETFDYLASGETLTLTYTIKATDDDSSNAFDEQTITITIVGTNDVPNITVESGDSDSSIINETNTTLSTNGTLSVIDLDRTDVITTSYVVSSVQKDANGNVMSTDSLEPTNVDLLNMLSITQTPIDGSNQTGTISWAFDSGSETFDYLASGETLTLTYTIKAIDDDSSNAFDEQTITITIVGTNDVPNITVESGDSDSSIINETNTTLSTNGTLSVIDLDRTDVITTSYVVSSVQKDANGNVMSTDSLEPTNVDLLNMLSITQTPIDGSNQTGTISWAFDSGSETFDYLASGETLTLTYTIKAIDDDSSNAFDEQTITITIVGTNDVPNITVESGDSDSSIINETNTTLSTNGTLSVIDLDRTDVITTSYVVSSVQKDANGNVMSTDSLEPTNVDLLNMLSITQTPIDGSNQTGTISWAFDSGSETFDYLASGETLTLTYTIKATDDDSSNAFDEQTITITIVGTNDAPRVLSDNIDDKTPFGKDFTKETAYLFSDLDTTDIFTFEAVNLPRGLVIDPNTGVISGRAKESGVFDITLIGRDSGNPSLSISRTFSLLVIAPPQPDTTVVVEPPRISETNTNNNDITLNNFNDNTQNLGVLNYSSSEGISTDTGIGFLDIGISQNNNPTDGANDNISTTNTSNPNDSKGVLQASVDLNVLTNGQVVFNEGNQDSFSIVGITIEDIKVENNFIEIKVVDTNLSQNFIVTQTDGTPLPAGLFFDPKTGNITGTIPEDLEKIDISIKAINQDGTTRVLNLKLDLKELKNKNQANQADADERYMGLKEQIAMENQKLDGYGSYLTRLFA